MTWNQGPLNFDAGTGGVNGQRLVKLSGGKVVHNTAAATDDPIGATLYNAEADHGVAVKTLNEPGTLEVEAAGAIPLDADCFAASSGKIQALPSTAGTYRRVGKLVKQAVGADGDVAQMLPYNDGKTVTVT